MEAEYKTLLQQQKAKKSQARVINDPGVWRNLGWAPLKPTQAKPYINSEGRQVMPTPLLNLAVAKTLLEQDRSPEALDQVYDLVAKAVKRQEKATSQSLESDSAFCSPASIIRQGTDLPLMSGLRRVHQNKDEGMRATGRMPSPYPPTTEVRPNLVA